jgi:hypothetical protein
MQVWNTNSGWFQIFRYEGEHIINIKNKKAFDVTGGKDEEARNVIVWKKHGGANQRWSIIYEDDWKEAREKGFNKEFGFKINEPFFIVSRLPMKRCAEVVGGRNIVLKTVDYERDKKEQHFVFDEVSKTIKSVRYMDRSLNTAGNNLDMRTTNSRWWYMFRYKDAHLVNEKGKAMDVQGGSDTENRNILMWNKHNGKNQQWDIVYVKDMPAEPKKGELNTAFGFYVERPFYIQSKLPSGRFIDLVGRDLVIKTRNGRSSQEWYFDNRSKTIKSKSNNQSIDIRGSGRQNHLQVWTTNSGWW